MIRILLVDDQPMIRVGIRGMLESRPHFAIVGEADDGEQAYAMARDLRPEVVLMDLRMPRVNGIEALSRIRQDPDLDSVHVLVLTTFEHDANVLDALQAGASGFIGKSVGPDELAEAVEAVAAGRPQLSDTATRALLAHVSAKSPPSEPVNEARLSVLTERERDVLEAVVRGGSNEEIAAEMFISPYTVKTHVNRAMTKLGARDRAQLVVIAFEAGLNPRI